MTQTENLLPQLFLKLVYLRHMLLPGTTRLKLANGWRVDTWPWNVAGEHLVPCASQFGGWKAQGICCSGSRDAIHAAYGVPTQSSAVSPGTSELKSLKLAWEGEAGKTARARD